MLTTYQKFFMITTLIWCCLGIVTACHDTNAPTAANQTPTPSQTAQPTPPSFTGTFRREYTVEATQGGTIAVTDTLTLVQTGANLTGERAVIGAHACCTANYSVAVTGIVTAERLAELTWGYAEGRCDGTGCWHGINTNGGTWGLSLSEDGANLNFAPGWDYARLAASFEPG